MFMAAGARDMELPTFDRALRSLDEALVAPPQKVDMRRRVVLEALGVKDDR